MQKTIRESLFGSRLRSLRSKHKLSANEFCAQYNERYDASLTRGTVSRYENETQLPQIDTMQKIAEFFNVSPSYITGATDIEECYDPRTGYKHELSVEEYELLRIFSSLGAKDRHKLMSVAFELEESEHNNQS